MEIEKNKNTNNTIGQKYKKADKRLFSPVLSRKTQKTIFWRLTVPSNTKHWVDVIILLFRIYSGQPLAD